MADQVLGVYLPTWPVELVASAEARERYGHCSRARLRALAGRLSRTLYVDLWRPLRIDMPKLAADGACLEPGLVGLGSFL